MTNLLLDTHVFLWWEEESPRLGKAARGEIADPGNRIFVSAVSVLEAELKARTGHLRLRGSLVSAITANAFHALPVLAGEAEAAGQLDWDHSDPFDRLLVAQAKEQSLVLVTADGLIRLYPGVAQIWAAS